MRKARESGAVLALAEADDGETDLVVGELAARGARVFWLDTAEFPLGLHVEAAPGPRWSGQLRLRRKEKEMALQDVRAVYFRRPTQFGFPQDMAASERRFAEVEARVGLGGLLASLPCRWVNHPSRVADAEYKPVQLQTAARCGLRIPETLLTNDARAVADFAAKQAGEVVYKPLAQKAVDEDGDLALVYTSPVDPAELDEREVGLTMHLFQERLGPKAYDARVTVVGRRLFTVAIHAGSASARLDWRSDYDNLCYELVEPPADVAACAVDYLQALALGVGAFDFTVTEGGQWVFLECNPSGQWAWLQEETGAPIAAAIADFLLDEDGPGEH